ncbi:MAG: hypothetical protein IKY13_01430, partial [Bacteroidaceae bacterium]|nr:hypothetical protein [Bacteroidaceae bacterium]
MRLLDISTSVFSSPSILIKVELYPVAPTAIMKGKVAGINSLNTGISRERQNAIYRYIYNVYATYTIYQLASIFFKDRYISVA